MLVAVFVAQHPAGSQLPFAGFDVMRIAVPLELVPDIDDRVGAVDQVGDLVVDVGLDVVDQDTGRQLGHQIGLGQVDLGDLKRLHRLHPIEQDAGHEAPLLGQVVQRGQRSPGPVDRLQQRPSLGLHLFDLLGRLVEAFGQDPHGVGVYPVYGHGTPFRSLVLNYAVAETSGSHEPSGCEHT